jgi:hypothetical protein
LGSRKGIGEFKKIKKFFPIGNIKLFKLLKPPPGVLKVEKV